MTSINAFKLITVGYFDGFNEVFGTTCERPYWYGHEAGANCLGLMPANELERAFAIAYLSQHENA